MIFKFFSSDLHFGESDCTEPIGAPGTPGSPGTPTDPGRRLPRHFPRRPRQPSMHRPRPNPFPRPSSFPRPCPRHFRTTNLLLLRLPAALTPAALALILILTIIPPRTVTAQTPSPAPNTPNTPAPEPRTPAPQTAMALAALQNTQTAPAFRALVAVQTTRDSKELPALEFDLYSRDNREILRYRSPPRDRGKLILQIEGSYWMYFPAVRRSIVLSPIGTLAGGVSNGDLLQPPLLTLYRITATTENPRSVTILLEARTLKAPYARIRAEFQNGRIIRADYFTRSGILVKQAEYSAHFLTEWGTAQVGEARITSPLKPREASRIILSDIRRAEIPAAWFNPNNLGALR